MVPRLKGILAGIEFYTDKTKLFGRKLPSDLFSKLKGEQGLCSGLTILWNQLKTNKTKNKTSVFL
jgi:hypothetical protein